MIVVVGQPLFRASKEGPSADGLPARIALAVAEQGKSVQLVGKAGEDQEGDAVVLALGQGGVGHVALLREAGRATPRATEPTDDDQAAPEDGVDPSDARLRSDAQVPAGATSGSTALDAGDVDLALRYLTEFAVLVLADPAEPDMVRVAADAASWAGALLIVVVRPGDAVPESLPPDVVVFEAPDDDPDGVFASMVGSFAAALDDGGDPAGASRSSIETDGRTASPVE